MSRRFNVTIEPASLEALAGEAELLQSAFWASFRETLGWKAHPFHGRCSDQEFHFLVLTRRLKLGLGLAYVPLGPGCPEPVQDQARLLEELGAAVTPHLPGGTLFIRFDPPWGTEGLGNIPRPLDKDGSDRNGTYGNGSSSTGRLVKAPMDIQPTSTVLIDLSPTEADILGQMKAKTRYNIRLSARKGVSVEHGGLAELRGWYRLYKETARRDRISLHSYAYYERLLKIADTFSNHDPKAGSRIELLLAWHGGELLAGIIVAISGSQARYLYGASAGHKRNLMPNYTLQWEAIRLAKAAGCRVYDLFGIPPADDSNHPMHGLFRFKTGFGGRIVNRYGSYDLALLRARYSAYRQAEALRRFYYRRLKKRLPRI